VSYELTAHSITRFRERVRPALSYRGAATELTALVALTDKLHPRPEWASAAGELYGSDGYLLLGDDVACPVFEGRVITVMVRGSYGKDLREWINSRKRAQRRAKRTHQSNHALRREEKASKRLPHRLFARTEEIDPNESDPAAGTGRAA
jgi:hypothetical protein